MHLTFSGVPPRGQENMLCQQDSQITIKTISTDSKSSGNQRSLSRVLWEVKCRLKPLLIREITHRDLSYISLKHPLPTTQEKTLHMDIIRWPTPKWHWLYLCSQRWRSSIQSAKTRLGADCGSDHELLIAKFRLKLKKVGKTARLFRYDLNQIPYDYTVEVRNRFKGLDLIDRVSEELWMEVHSIVQEAVTKIILK